MGVLDKKNFLGGLNQDTEQRLLPQGDYRDARNVRIVESESDDAGAVQNIEGVEKILSEGLFQIGDVNHKVVGVYEDKYFDRLIFFVDGLVAAYVYEYNLKTNRSFPIWKQAFASFRDESGEPLKITGINVIAHEQDYAPEGILFFTNNLAQPFKINIAKSKLTEGVAFITNGLYTSPLSGFTTSNYDANLSAYDTFGVVQMQNYRAIPFAPEERPSAVYVSDTSRNTNYVKENCFQFKYRYLYYDRQYSSWSPISDVKITHTGTGYSTDPDTYNNAIDINFTFGNPGCEIIGVQLAAKKSQIIGDEFVLIEEIMFDEPELVGLPAGSTLIPGDQYNYRFYNDGVYNLLDVKESIKPFDEVPMKAKAQEVIDGNRIVYANVVTGKDPVKTNGTTVSLSNTQVYNTETGGYNFKNDPSSGLAYDPSALKVITKTDIRHEKLKGGLCKKIGHTANFQLELQINRGTEGNSGSVNLNLEDIPIECHFQKVGCNNWACCTNTTVARSYLLSLNLGANITNITAPITATQLRDLLFDELITNYGNASPSDDISGFIGGGSIFERHDTASNFKIRAGKKYGVNGIDKDDYGGSSSNSEYNLFETSGTNKIVLRFHITNDQWLFRNGENIRGKAMFGRVSGNHHEGIYFIEDSAIGLAQTEYTISAHTGGNYNNNPDKQNIYDALSAAQGYQVEFSEEEWGGGNIYSLHSLGGVPFVASSDVIGMYEGEDYAPRDRWNTFYADNPQHGLYGLGPGSSAYVYGSGMVGFIDNGLYQTTPNGFFPSHDFSSVPYTFANNLTGGSYDGNNQQFTVEWISTTQTPPTPGSFKTGAEHSFGLIYYDKEGRHGAVNPVGSVYVPDVIESGVNITFGLAAQANLINNIDWNITHPAPAWADRYRWAYTGNENYKNFEQFEVDNFYYDDDNYPTKIFMPLEVLDKLKDGAENDAVFIDYQIGDRIKIIDPDVMTSLGLTANDKYDFRIIDIVTIDDAGNFILSQEPLTVPNTGTETEELKLTNYRTALDVGANPKSIRYAVISSQDMIIPTWGYPDSDTSQPVVQQGEIIGNCLVEIYSKRKQISDDERFYFEFEDAYPITNGVHSVPSGTFARGDIYVRQGDFPVETPLLRIIESQHFSPKFKSDAWDKGRPNRIIKTLRETRKKVRALFSQPYIYGTDINGAGTIYPDDTFIDFNESYGSIQKIFKRNDSLILFQEDKISRSLINKSSIFSGDGKSDIALSDSVLSKPIAYAGDFGISKNPESFAENNGIIYFFDLDRAAALRLSQDGLTPISDNFMKSYFKNKSQSIKSLLNQTNTKSFRINGGFDSKNGEYFVSFEGMYEYEQVNLCELASSGDYDSNVTYGYSDVVFYNGVYYTSICDNNTQPPNVSPIPPATSCWNVCSAILGCTDPNAQNFNPAAIYDDGSCIYPCLDLVPTEIAVSQIATANETTTTNPDLSVTSNGNGSFALFTSGNNNFSFLVYYEGGLLYSQLLDSSSTLNMNNLSAGVYTVIMIDGTDPYLENLQIEEPDGSLDYDAFGELIDFMINCGLAIDIEIFLEGCTDPTASNYIQEATIDDGSCVTIIEGCTDPNALNYDANATVDDGSCTYPVIYGCTDANADNWNPQATDDDGSCIYCSTFSLNIGSQTDVTTYGACDGTAYVFATGGSSPYSINFPQNPNAMCEGTYLITATDADGCAASIELIIGGPNPVYGCTDPLANNYDPTANIDDGSCNYCPTDYGVTVSSNNATAIGGDGDYEITFTPNNDYSLNDEVQITVNGNVLLTFINNGNTQTSGVITASPGSYVVIVQITSGVNSGCQNTLSFSISSPNCPPLFQADASGQAIDENNPNLSWNNFFPINSGACCTKGKVNDCNGQGSFFVEYFGGGMGTSTFWDTSAIIIEDGNGAGDVVCVYDPNLHGFHQTTPTNTATIDVILISGPIRRIEVTGLATDSYKMTWEVYDIDGNVVCSESIYSIDIGCLGCMDDGTSLTHGVYAAIPGMAGTPADNYNPQATYGQWQAQCIYTISACTDNNASTYGQDADYVNSGGAQGHDYNNYEVTWPTNLTPNPLLNVSLLNIIDDGSCATYGCTDPNASNYDANAVQDPSLSQDADCIYEGCTDPTALNYDANANSDNGSCQYCSDFYNSTAEIISVDALLGTVNVQVDVNIDVTVIFGVAGTHLSVIDYGPGQYNLTFTIPNYNPYTNNSAYVEVIPLDAPYTNCQPIGEGVNFISTCPAASGTSFPSFEQNSPTMISSLNNENYVFQANNSEPNVAVINFDLFEGFNNNFWAQALVVSQGGINSLDKVKITNIVNMAINERFVGNTDNRSKSPFGSSASVPLFSTTGLLFDGSGFMLSALNKKVHLIIPSSVGQSSMSSPDGYFEVQFEGIDGYGSPFVCNFEFACYNNMAFTSAGGISSGRVGVGVREAGSSGQYYEVMNFPLQGNGVPPSSNQIQGQALSQSLFTDYFGAGGGTANAAIQIVNLAT